MKTLAIIDGHNFLFKSFAAPFEFSSEKGIRLDVLTVFLSFLRSAISKVDASHVAVVFDHPEADNYRLKSSEYKSDRVQDFSDELDSPFHHLDNLKLVLKYVGVRYIESDLAEGDDIIFTIASNFVEEGGAAYIASSDTDFYQCLSDNLKILRMRGSKNIEILSEQWLLDNLCIRATQYVKFKALTGDKADNISGIKGVGPKTAFKILSDKKLEAEYGSSHGELIEGNMDLIKLRFVNQLELENSECLLKARTLFQSNRGIFEALGF
jgi:DNA polymerase-1